MCLGWTQRMGLEHWSPLTRRSPSVLSSGIPLNKMTITRSKRHTCKDTPGGVIWEHVEVPAALRGARQRSKCSGRVKRTCLLRWSSGTLSACRRQSMRLILPFWSGFERTQHAAFLPVTESTKSSLHSGLMSFRSLARRRLAHFCFTWQPKNRPMTNTFRSKAGLHSD